MSIFEITVEGDSVEAQLKKYGNAATVTEGESMRPLFKTHRDMVVLEAVSSPLKKYDVVMYKVGENYVMHRIIGVLPEKQVYVIRGDNTFKKEYVPFERIIARLVSFSRRGRDVSVNNLLYKTYSRFWNFIYPLRYVLRAPKVLLRRLLRKIRKLKKGR